MFTVNNFAVTLICITIAAMLLTLTNIWFPQLFTDEVKKRIIWTFITIAVSVGIISFVLQYLNK